MGKRYLKNYSRNTKHFVSATLYIIVFMLFSVSCTKNLLPETTVRITESHSGINKLNEIKPASTENVSGIIPLKNENDHLVDFPVYTGKYLNTIGADREKIIETAYKYLSVPYRMGGTSMKGIDCSGLLVRVFATYGINLPHNAQDQARYGKVVTGVANLQRGDLVFFKKSFKTAYYITHVGIYLGNNEFIHASVNSGVTVTSLDDKWWRPKFVFGTRIFE